MNWYLKVLKQYVDFDGRARRKEYWMFLLVNIVVSIVIGIVDVVAGLKTSSGIGILGALYSLAILLPSLGVTVRRLHDIDKSGWWVLIGFVPIIGFIVLLVFAAMEGTRGDNQYGPDPKAAGDGVPAIA